jgi:hypothetical protein
MSEAKRFKAEGVKPSVPDTVFPIARFPWHGLFIEMKKEGEQARFQKRLLEQGYLAVTCQTKDAAIGVVDWYLALRGWPATSAPLMAEGQLSQLASREKVFVHG